MIKLLRASFTAFLLLILGGCFVEVNDEETTESEALNDGIAQDPNADLFSDGLIPPTAPELSIGASLGTLEFSWVNKDDSTEPVISTRLYEFDSSTGIETEVNDAINNDSSATSLAIAPHKIAWDTLSYRVEICTSSNCLSSLRMPIDTLLADALEVVQPSNADIFPSYGSHLAVNGSGNVAIVANPQGNNATVLFKPAEQWILASTLTPSDIDQTADHALRVAISATGDTLAIAFVGADANPHVAIFERLGENWIETESIAVFRGNQLSDLTRQWNTDSLHMQLSDTGDRLAIGVQQANQTSRASDREQDNQVVVFERSTLNWTVAASLSVPNLHFRLRSFSGSSELDTILALSTADGALYLNEYRLTNNSWQTRTPQLLNNVGPASDAQVLGSADATKAAIASWESDSTGSRAPVAWRLERQTAGWVATDSVRQANITNATAQLRLASDAQLNNLAFGWQASSTARLTFYTIDDQQWQTLFEFPRALSVAFSSDNTTALVGATGGFFSFAAID